MSTSPSQYLDHDRWVWWMGIPILTLLVQHIGISWEEIKDYVTLRSYWYNLIYNSALIFLNLWLLKQWIKCLDQRLPYRPHFAKRILLQLSISIVGLMALIESLTFLYVKVWMKGDYWDNHWNTDIIFSVALIMLINLIYVCLYLIYEEKSTSVTETAPNITAASLSPQQINVQLGSTKFSLFPDEIALIVSTNRLVKVITLEKKSYWSNKSLRQLTDQLDPHQFYRANRQILIHRQLIKGYRKLPNRKLLLILTSPTLFEEDIFISKEKASTFQNWL
ncbi:MAG: LytTR family DNA-binding domain-containing protein [Bacteroidota bacterium]